MTDKMIVRYCAPTLAGLKTGSMFSCPYDSRRALAGEIRKQNRRLAPKGLRILLLRFSKKRALIYVFRPSDLERDLSNQAVAELLERFGYPDTRMAPCIGRLIRRFRQEQEFPHEVGVFLGYPPEDVRGFIDNKAGGQKCAGCWKVYGDEAAAKAAFDKFRKCTRIYCTQWEQGIPMEQLAVAG